MGKGRTANLEALMHSLLFRPQYEPIIGTNSFEALRFSAVVPPPPPPPQQCLKESPK